MLRSGAVVVVTLLAGCGTSVTESRGQMRGGTFNCQSDTLPSPMLVVNSDGAYELRWRDSQDRSETGWIEAAGSGLRPTSGPLQGATLTWTGDGGLTAAGTTVITACGAAPS